MLTSTLCHKPDLQWLGGIVLMLTGLVQVSIPQSLAWKCVGLGALSWVLTNAWEQLLRNAFPSPRPPRKGYEVHKHLLKPGKGAADTNGSLGGHQHVE